MTDKELLELAAKAYGISDLEHDISGFYRVIGEHEDGQKCMVEWNPLEDDGDAFRLAVKLSMKVYAGEAYPWDEDVCNYSRSFSACVDEDEEPDPYAATRRAIVRSAAIVGSKQ